MLALTALHVAKKSFEAPHFRLKKMLSIDLEVNL